MPHPHRHPNPDSPGPYLHQIRTREMSQYIWYAKISQQPRHDWKPRQRPASGRRELARGEQKFSCHVQNILRGGFSQPSAHLAGGRALSAHRTIKMIAERVRQRRVGGRNRPDVQRSQRHSTGSAGTSRERFSIISKSTQRYSAPAQDKHCRRMLFHFPAPRCHGVRVAPCQ
jgi:hypothetical protein